MTFALAYGCPGSRNTPEEAESMKLRSFLMMVLKNYITRTGASHYRQSRDYKTY